MTNREITTAWSTLIVDELVRQGISRFCISPGSRSTPLTAAAARHEGTICGIFPDERAAAFFALGYARATAIPAVLVCTSGTAVANYFPAIVEASIDNQPMLVLSADRPFELLDTGANQTIRQQGIFGSYTRWHMELSEPSEAIPAKALLSTITEAVRKSLGTPPGPVHLNLPFREPFDPVALPSENSWNREPDKRTPEKKPFTGFTKRHTATDKSTIEHLHGLVAEASSVLITAGNLDSDDEAGKILSLAETMNVPLYADISSGLRLREERYPLQPLLLSERFTASFTPDLVLHFGGKLVGKRLPAAVQKWQPRHFIVINGSPSRLNPDHNVTLQIETPPGDCALRLASRVERTFPDIHTLNKTSLKIEEELDRWTAPEKPVNEINASRIISDQIPQGHGLFLANSMPIRDMDTFAARRSRSDVPRCIMNRGASGIDGNIATAVGFAQGTDAPVTVLIGDISFLHDINSLTLLQSQRCPVHIVVLNNNGGGIFSFLPIASEKDIFEPFFGTPQSYSIRSAAKTFGIDYQNPATNRQFIDCYAAMCRSNRSGIIEISSSRQQNLEEHKKLNDLLLKQIDLHLCS